MICSFLFSYTWINSFIPLRDFFVKDNVHCTVYEPYSICSSQVTLSCQFFRCSWQNQNYLFVITRTFRRRCHHQFSTCHSEENHRLSSNTGPAVYLPRVIVVFHSFCTRIMTILSEDWVDCDLLNTKIRYFQTSRKMFRSSGTRDCIST